MEEVKGTVENAIVEGTGAIEEVVKPTEDVAVEKTEESVEAKAQKIADAIVARKLAKMPTKEELAEYKEYKESQKTETEKQAEALKELETLRQEKLNTQRENALLRKGINNEDIDYVMFKVGKLDGEFDENLETFLKDNPKYLSKDETKVANTTGVKTNGSTTKEDGVMAILKQKHPELYE